MKKFRPYYLAIAALFSLNMAAQPSFPGAETILYGTPEGTLHENEVRYATSFYDPGEGVAYLDSVGYYTATYVTADDGSVYDSDGTLRLKISVPLDRIPYFRLQK